MDDATSSQQLSTPPTTDVPNPSDATKKRPCTIRDGEEEDIVMLPPSNEAKSRTLSIASASSWRPSTLQSLSIDAMTIIQSHLEAAETGRLVLTGSKLLARNVLHSIQVVSISHHTAMHILCGSSSRWCSFINFVSGVAGQLVRLDMVFTGAFLGLLTGPGCGLTPQMPILPNLKTLSMHDLLFLSSWSNTFEHYFPHLEELQIVDSTSTFPSLYLHGTALFMNAMEVKSASTVSPLVLTLPVMPTSLRTLRWTDGGRRADPIWTLFSHSLSYATSLTDLDLSSRNYVIKICGEETAGDNDDNVAAAAACLPPSLTKLCVRPHKQTPLASLLRHLPNLTDLEINVGQEFAATSFFNWADIPMQQLERLIVRLSSSNAQIPDAPIPSCFNPQLMRCLRIQSSLAPGITVDKYEEALPNLDDFLINRYVTPIVREVTFIAGDPDKKDYMGHCRDFTGSRYIPRLHKDLVQLELYVPSPGNCASAWLTHIPCNLRVLMLHLGDWIDTMPVDFGPLSCRGTLTDLKITAARENVGTHEVVIRSLPHNIRAFTCVAPLVLSRIESRPSDAPLKKLAELNIPVSAKFSGWKRLLVDDNDNGTDLQRDAHQRVSSASSEIVPLSLMAPNLETLRVRCMAHSINPNLVQFCESASSDALRFIGIATRSGQSLKLAEGLSATFGVERFVISSSTDKQVLLARRELLYENPSNQEEEEEGDGPAAVRNEE